MSFFESVREVLPDPVEFWEKIASAAPNVLAAIALLVFGHFIAKFIGFAIARILKKVGLDRLGEKAGLNDMAERTGLSMTASDVFGKIIYWLIFLTFLISAADALGLERVSDTINGFVAYLPKLIGALMVLIIGLFAAQFVRSIVEAALGSINLGYEKAVGTLIYAIIVIVVTSLAIGQLEVETDLLNQVISIVLMACAAAVALAMGLGTRDVAGNIVAGVYARDLYTRGKRITVGEVSGTILEVASTSILVDTGDGQRVSIPNRRLLEETVVLDD
ncbi:MAG: mechanosensitive ion channel domain-containing protein [Pseudomonadota bacterium]